LGGEKIVDLVDGGVIVSVVASARAIEALAKLFWNKRNNRNPRNDNKPGRSDICLQHIRELGELSIKVGGVKDDVQELKGDVRELKKSGLPA